MRDGQVVDAKVTLGAGKKQVHCRLRGVPAPDGSYRFYLTNLPPRVGPHQVADFYRVRWESESDNKLDKSCSHLQEISAQTGPVVRALLHTSLISSMLACLLVPRYEGAVEFGGAELARSVWEAHYHGIPRSAERTRIVDYFVLTRHRVL